MRCSTLASATNEGLEQGVYDMTADAAMMEIAFENTRPHRTLWGDVWIQFRKHKLAIVGLVTLIFLVLFSFAGPLLYRVEPEFIDITQGNQQPNSQHLFGTDMLGRDTLARVMAGGRISLAVGLSIGFAAQRSRFCTMGAFRDLILFRQAHLFLGLLALVALAFITNLMVGQFHPGFVKQPVAHTMQVWNFGGMVLAGLAFALAGGCPGRQLFLAGEGDGDAAVFVLGMIVGAGFAHNFGLASSPKGVGPHGIAAVIIGLVVCLFIGFTMRKK